MEKTSLKLFNFTNISTDFSLQYNKTDINPLESIKVLGILLNNNLDKTSFIANKVRVCNFHLKNLWSIESSLTIQTKIILITNLILSNIDYCNVLLFRSTKKQLYPLNLIINKSVRFIFKVPKRHHITPYLKKVHFLPLHYRINYKICLLAHKIFHLSSPGYLAHHFEPYQPSTSTNLRQVGRDSFMFDTKLTDYKKNSLISGIKLEWNNLPIDIRKEYSKNIFKIKLKTYLFKKAFDC